MPLYIETPLIQSRQLSQFSGRAPTVVAFTTVLVVMCGGATATTDQLEQWAKSL